MRNCRQGIARPGHSRRLLLFLLVCGASCGFFFAGAEGCWAAENEAIRLFREYLRIDTSNPPGNELTAARFLSGVLQREGIEHRVFDLGNNRANVYAILRGNGTARPVILMHHLDVVPADPKYWTLPPFSGETRKGEVFGRGAIDIKGKGLIDLVTLVHLKRAGVELARDIIFLGVADEEGASLGARELIKTHPELIRDAEFLINEGEAILSDRTGKVTRYPVAIAEKYPLWLKLVFRGEPGHGSVPLQDSSVNHLIMAARKLMHWHQPVKIVPELMENIRMELDGVRWKKYPGFAGTLEKSLEAPEFLRRILRNDEIRAGLSNTVSMTMLQGSDKINTIPNEAALGIDCRLLPGESPLLFIEKIRNLVDDPAMEIQIVEMSQDASSTFSPVDSAFMQSLKRCAQKFDPGAVVTPVILTSSTDSSYFRALGIHAYGFEPYRLTKEDYGLAHGNDERISEANILFGIDLLTDLLKDLCGKKALRSRP